MFVHSRWIILLIFAAHFVIIWAATYFKTTNIECVTSPKYFYNHSCSLKAINRYKTVAKMTSQLIDSLRNVSVNLAVYKRNDVGIYRPFLVNISFNICDFFKRRKFNPYMSVVMKTLTKFTNVNHSCPLTGTLIADGLYLEQSVFPCDFPESSYKAQFKFFEAYPYDLIGNVALYLNLLNIRE